MDSCPVVYEVGVKARPGIGAKFIDWMKKEHARDLLRVEGCFECSVFQVEKEHYLCQYFFQTQQHIDNYLSEKAEDMRQRASKHVAEGDRSQRVALLGQVSVVVG